jgi:hypothetical protein
MRKGVELLKVCKGGYLCHYVYVICNVPRTPHILVHWCDIVDCGS